MKRLLPLVLFAALLALPAAAQTAPPAGAAAPSPDGFTKIIKTSFDGITRFLAASAEKMPEAQFGFKPTPEVRSFGEILGHVANSQFSYCARIKGEKNPNEGNDIEKKTAKADLVKALNDSITYCSTAYADMTDAKALELLPVPPAPAGVAANRPAPAPAPKVRLLLGNITHDWEHYGNLVTYMRLKGIVPPSSEPRR
ncbi:MAG TPA: DinB family protein [Vicinamibacterales bacterium]|jgi:uncharacterized damage-inducible protein DinB